MRGEEEAGHRSTRDESASALTSLSQHTLLVCSCGRYGNRSQGSAMSPNGKRTVGRDRKKSYAHHQDKNPESRGKKVEGHKNTHSGIYIALFDKWMLLLCSTVDKDALQIISGLPYVS